MAFKKTLAQRLFNAYKTTNFSISTCRITPSSSSMASKSLTTHPPDNKIAPDPGDNGTFRRFLHRYPSPAISPDLRSLPSGEKLIEKLREMDTERNRIRLDGLLTPEKLMPEETSEGKLTVEDARKLLKLSQLEMVKLKLRKIGKNCISYSEFVQICCESCSNSTDQCLEFAKILDDSGSVIVLGNVVFLRPDQENETKLLQISKRDGDFYKGVDQSDHFQRPKIFFLNTFEAFNTPIFLPKLFEGRHSYLITGEKNEMLKF